ncbi:hypothetical protein ABT124_47895, partial [Streptomyces sp. NPDC001982]|uniref:hypothetical protein n=1 Tax=Streptomyces sp. NPDC001982 TaxID=3154405 RepID=UPI00331FF9FF
MTHASRGAGADPSCRLIEHGFHGYVGAVGGVGVAARCCATFDVLMTASLDLELGSDGKGRSDGVGPAL